MLQISSRGQLNTDETSTSCVWWIHVTDYVRLPSKAKITGTIPTARQSVLINYLLFQFTEFPFRRVPRITALWKTPLRTFPFRPITTRFFRQKNDTSAYEAQRPSWRRDVNSESRGCKLDRPLTEKGKLCFGEFKASIISSFCFADFPFWAIVSCSYRLDSMIESRIFCSRYVQEPNFLMLQ